MVTLTMAAAAWILVALAVGMLVGCAIRSAENSDPTTEAGERRDLLRVTPRDDVGV